MPTDAEIAAAKAEAAQRFGRAELLLCTYKAPIDIACLIAPIDFAAYCMYQDDVSVDQQTGYRNLARARRVWPDAMAFEDRLSRRPALAHKIVMDVMLRAGNVPGDPRVELLGDVIARTAKDAIEVIPGLAPGVAAKMIADAEAGEELWSIVGPGPLSCVMVSPDGEVWLAAKTAGAKAGADRKRVVEAVWDFVRQGVRWAREPVDTMLNDRPCLYVDMRNAYDTLGGEDAEGTAKSV